MVEAALAAMIEASRASGTIVQVELPAFLWVLEQQEAPLVVYAVGGFFKKHFKYLTSYKGLCFFAKLPNRLDLPPNAQVVLAKTIWVPSGF
jgi:hypothetical protein